MRRFPLKLIDFTQKQRSSVRNHGVFLCNNCFAARYPSAFRFADFRRVCNQPFSATSLRGAILAASNRQNRGERFRKFFRGEFSEAFPSEFARLTAPQQSKENFFSPNSRDFGGVEPPKSLGENSCFPLKPFSALWRIAALRAE